MAVKLNHTIVHSQNPRAAAEFFAGLFGLPAPKPFEHYAFLVSDGDWPG